MKIEVSVGEIVDKLSILKIKKNNIYGFQFHPESFLTENGHFIIKKII